MFIITAGLDAMVKVKQTKLVSYIYFKGNHPDLLTTVPQTDHQQAKRPVLPWASGMLQCKTINHVKSLEGIALSG